MKRRQTPELARLADPRMVRAGEVDHEIDTKQLLTPPAPIWDTATLATCASIYDRYVHRGTGGIVPTHLFYDLPRRTFLDYAVCFRDALLVGSNDPGKTQLEPVVLSQNIYEWTRPRYFAFANSTEALFRAILDVARLRDLDCASISTIAMPVDRATEAASRGFYFGLDYRALPEAPWRSGTVYLYPRSLFAQDFETTPFLTDAPIRPLARLQVHPWDWPFLDQVLGVNIPAQTARQRDTFLGYPWALDPAIHPHRSTRPLIDQIRAYLEADCAAPADLSALGQRFGIGPFALLRRFRAHVGLSPREYQMLLRIDRAKKLLAAGLPIAQAAAESGFCDQTHLARHFRAIVGLTPGRYLRAQEYPIG